MLWVDSHPRQLLSMAGANRLLNRREMIYRQRMNKSTKKATDKTQMSYRTPALRSEAFDRALRDANLRAAGPGGLRSLFEKAAREVARLPRQRFKENWPYLQAMLRLIRAHERGEYQQITKANLLWVVAALTYLVDPYDFIPDATPLLGFVDDAIVVDFVLGKTRQVLDDFMVWETSGAHDSKQV
jgi:uncharacterized membrane protein YkvA (DUF1232 family)